MLRQCGDLSVVGDCSAELFETVLSFLLLQDPREPGLAVIPKLDDVFETQDAGWESQLCLKFYDFLLADIMSFIDFCVGAVLLNVFGGHLHFLLDEKALNSREEKDGMELQSKGSFL